MIVEHDCDLRIAVKPCVCVSEVRSLWGNRHSAGFKQDGLIFMPIKEKVKFGKSNFIVYNKQICAFE